MGVIKGFLETGKNLEKIIFDMLPDEEGWTNPNSLELDLELKGYLDLERPVSQHYDSLNKRTLYIKRIGEGKDDYLVDISRAEGYAWISLSEEKIKDFLEEIGEEKVAKLDYKPNLIFEEVKLEEDIQEALENEQYELVEELKQKRDSTLKKNL